MIKKDKLNKTIDELAAKWDTSGIVMVYKDDVFIHDAVYGYQDRQIKSPISTKDSYSLSLRSHFFLGLAMMILLDNNKISYNDSLDQFIPEYEHAKKIKIIDLINHRSGIMDYFYSHTMIKLQESMAHQEKSEEKRYQIERLLFESPTSFAQVMEIVRDKPLDFEPQQRDTDWSATNAIFLHEVIERICGISLFDFLKQNVFIPWGLNTIQQGSKASTVSYGCIKEVVQVRLPIEHDIDYAITLTKSDVKALMIGLIEQKTFKKATWKKALEFNSEGYSLLAENANGIPCGAANLLGYEMNLYFDQEESLSYVHLTNEMQTMKRINDEWYYFRREMRTEIEAATTFPNNTTLERYNESNAWAAMQLKVDDQQQSYVFDAKTSLAYTLIKPQRRKAYVLVEKNRAIGILVLSIDKKQTYYNIDVVLVDKRYQRRGYGKIMLAEAIKILKQNGAKKIEIGVSRFNIAAQRLYKSMGFVEAAVYEGGMGLRLDL